MQLGNDRVVLLVPEFPIRLLSSQGNHFQTEPDLYRDDETYVAIQWDFSDFEEKVRALLDDKPRRARIAENAWQTVRHYLENNGPVKAYADIFSAAG